MVAPPCDHDYRHDLQSPFTWWSCPSCTPSTDTTDICTAFLPCASSGASTDGRYARKPADVMPVGIKSQHQSFELSTRYSEVVRFFGNPAKKRFLPSHFQSWNGKCTHLSADLARVRLETSVKPHVPGFRPIILNRRNRHHLRHRRHDFDEITWWACHCEQKSFYKRRTDNWPGILSFAW